MAIRRYARALIAIVDMREKELPVLPHQQTALARAGEALDLVLPYGDSRRLAVGGR